MEVQLGATGFDSNDCRALVHIIELGAVGLVSDHDSGAGLLQAMLDGLRPECSEQRLVYGAKAPGGENGNQQLSSAWHQACDPVTWAYPLGLEHSGKTGGLCFELIESVARGVAITILVNQRQRALAGMAIATLNTGIERIEVAMQGTSGCLAKVEPSNGLSVIAHRWTPGLLLLE
jgi:hypothetical protein